MTPGTGEMEADADADADDCTAVRELGGPLSSWETLSPDSPTPLTARPGTVKARLAAETLRLYAGDWAYFQDYCVERRAKAMPANPELAAAFLAFRGVRRAALARRLAAIDHQHRQRGLPTPGADPSVRAVLRKARRAVPRQTRTAAPTPATLTQMADTCRGDLAGLQDRALLLLLAAGLARATIVALQAEHLRFTEPGLALTVNRSGEPPQMHHLPRSTSPALCPVRAMEDWLRSSNTRYGPVFRKVNRWASSSTPRSTPTLSAWPQSVVTCSRAAE